MKKKIIGTICLVLVVLAVGGLYCYGERHPIESAPAPTVTATIAATPTLAPIATPKPICTPIVLPYHFESISRGAQGNRVFLIQNKLVELGYLDTADGIFGAKTENATKNFQKENNLKVDGIVGVDTFSLLIVQYR